MSTTGSPLPLVGVADLQEHPRQRVLALRVADESSVQYTVMSSAAGDVLDRNVNADVIAAYRSNPEQEKLNSLAANLLSENAPQALAQLEKLGIQCKVVEKNEARCRQLAEWFPHALILHGDGTDPELLTEECMPASDVFIALTDRDEDNLIISLYAHQCGVSKIIAKSGRR